MGWSFIVGNTNILVYILIVLFAISSWIDVNGIWVELPILVHHLPEQWKFPSYMSVVIQLANIGPVIYIASNVIWPGKAKEKPTIYAIIVVGAIACLLAVFFWNETATVFGNSHSVALLSLLFFLSLVDCTSSVTYLPYMAIFKPQYLTAMYIGEGLSGLLPSVVALIQGSGDVVCKTTNVNQTQHNGSWVNITTMEPEFLDPLFSVEVFFLFIFSMLIVSFVSFALLNNLKMSRHEQQYHAAPTENEDSLTTSDYHLSDVHPPSSVPQFDNPILTGDEHTLVDNNHSKGLTVLDDGRPQMSLSKTTMSRWTKALLLSHIFWANALTNSALASVQSYSCLPYGTSTYHFAVTLGSMANPISCFMSFFVPVTSKVKISVMFIIGTIVGGFILFIASMSPEPPLRDNVVGSVIVVSSWVVVMFLLTYVKVAIASLLRMEGRSALLWCGSFTQLGSAVGATVMFVLINVKELFISAPYC